MSNPQFGFDELEPSQSQPHVPINAADRTLSAAIAGEFVFEFTSDANYTLEADEWAYGVIRATDTSLTLTAARDVIYPDVDSLEGVETSRMTFVFVNDTAEDLTIKRSGQTGVTVPAGESALVRHDGLDIVAVAAAGGSSGGGDASEGHGSLTSLNISSNAVTIDHSKGACFTLTLTDNVTTVTHSNITSSEANWFSLRIRQDGTGGRSFTPPASWIYPSGVSAYTPSSGANDVDLLQGITFDNGTTWMVDYAKDYV